MRAWEQLPAETSKAFAAYKTYRDLGPGRSINEAYRVHIGEQGSNKRASGRWRLWSGQHQWVERVREYDARDDVIRREAIALHDLNRAADAARRVEDLREKNLANEEKAARATEQYLDRAIELIETLPVVEKTVERVENGIPVAYTIHPATKNPALDAARLHKIATQGDPAKVDVRQYDYDSATEDQLDRIIAGEDPAKVFGEGSGGIVTRALQYFDDREDGSEDGAN